MSEENNNEGVQNEDGKQSERSHEKGEERTFTQADLDRIVQERIQRERAKFSDYDELKKRAGEKATLEDRVAAMEQRAVKAELSALRNEIASNYKIDADDRDLFMTGADGDTLTAQAKRLAERSAANDRRGTAPNEGRQKSNNNADERETVRQLFGKS